MTQKQEHIAALLAANTPFRNIQRTARATPQEINQVKRLLNQQNAMKTQEIKATIEANTETDAQVQLPLQRDIHPLTPVPMTDDEPESTATLQERCLMLADLLLERIPEHHAAHVFIRTAKEWLLAEPLANA
jgi:hypothetical protein